MFVNFFFSSTKKLDLLNSSELLYTSFLNQIFIDKIPDYTKYNLEKPLQAAPIVKSWGSAKVLCRVCFLFVQNSDLKNF